MRSVTVTALIRTQLCVVRVYIGQGGYIFTSFFLWQRYLFIFKTLYFKLYIIIKSYHNSEIWKKLIKYLFKNSSLNFRQNFHSCIRLWARHSCPPFTPPTYPKLCNRPWQTVVGPQFNPFQSNFVKINICNWKFEEKLNLYLFGWEYVNGNKTGWRPKSADLMHGCPWKYKEINMGQGFHLSSHLSAPNIIKGVGGS